MSRLTFVPLSAIACVLVAYTIVEVDPSANAVLVLAIAVACSAPVAVRLATGRFDIFEPIVAINLALLVMYVARPGAMLATGSQHTFKSYDITPQIREALVIALVGALALQLGYAAPTAKRVGNRIGRESRSWDTGATVVFSLALAGVAFLLFAAFAARSGGFSFVLQMLQGRNSSFDTLYRNSTAYFYGAPALLWPASLLLFATGLKTRRRDVTFLSLVLIVALGVFSGGQGARITFLPLVLSPIVYYYLARGRRPGPLALVLGGYLVFTIGIAYFREARTATESTSRTYQLKEALANPGYEYRKLVFEGVDNDMFESLAAETIVVPSKIGGSPTDFVYRLAAKPIPTIVWSSKPRPPEEQLATTLYPWERERNSSSSGVIGSFFQAGLLPGVALGMLLVGFVFRFVWEYWRGASRSMTANLILTASLMLVPIVLRGGLGETIVHAFFGIVPLLVAARFCVGRSSSTAHVMAALPGLPRLSDGS